MALDAPQPAESVVHPLRDPEVLIVKKVDFVVFIAQVINCTSQTNKKSNKLYIIVNAAKMFLDLLKNSCECCLKMQIPFRPQI